jgi:Superinfection immunity protein
MDTASAVVGTLSLVVLCGALYFIPLIVAWDRGHSHVLAIGVINVFAGWTLIGWVGALAWACTAYKPYVVTPPPPPPLFPRTPRTLRHPPMAASTARREKGCL